MENDKKEIKKITSKIVSWKVSSKEDKKETLSRPTEIQFVQAPKRPSELECDIKKAKIHGEAWTLFVGLLNGRPYEIFGGLSKFVDIPNKLKTGKIVKGKKIDGVAVYNLILGEGEDEMIIKDIVSVFENTTNGAFTRAISLALRHGVPIQYLCEQLLKDKHSDMTSFTKVISRVLKSYIKDGTKVSSQQKCESCGEEGTLIYKEGCLTCTCGYSKCS